MSFKREEPTNIKDNREIVEILKRELKGKNIPSEEYNTVKIREFSIDSMLITVVLVSETLLKEMKREKQTILEEIEEITDGTVFIIRARQGEEVQGSKGQPVFKSGTTYVDYQELVACDLVAPSHIVDRRTVIREDGSRIEKMIIDLKSKKDMANRFEPMAAVFESLFSRRAVFQANYY